MLSREVDERGSASCTARMDLPLLAVLLRMERAGIRVEPAELAGLSSRMETDIERLTAEIHALAGRPFNINSPQQLAKVLFEELGLPSAREERLRPRPTCWRSWPRCIRLRPRCWSTAQLAKLKGTYVDTLPVLIDPASGRLHTSFNPTGAATGRLSSSNPNLQNIPIRTELGREIRAAFLPSEGWKLLVADYSQIELRLLAHMSRDRCWSRPSATARTSTRARRRKCSACLRYMVTPEMRRNAKAVNFGIVYGQSAFGLAAQLGIPQSEAQKLHTGLLRAVRRREALHRPADRGGAPQRGDTHAVRAAAAHSGNQQRQRQPRGFAERTAVNTPLQGTAADLIKLAMIAIDRELRARGARTAMLLQVHDELVFEAPPEEVEEIGRLVKREMEAAHPLEVPLIADVGVGDNWRDAK